MNYYQIRTFEEAHIIQKAFTFYQNWADLVRSGAFELDYLKHYYAKSLGVTQGKQFRFRALFFATRLQPILSYVHNFGQQHGRPPYILDLGCGFGLESLLIGATGAKVHGVDYSAEKIDFAPQLQKAYEDKHQITLDIRFEQASLFAFRALTGYDAVYSSATLHHIEPADQAIQAVANLLVPGGDFFLSDENGLSPIQQIAVQKRIGWTASRRVWRTNASGERFLYGNENIRPPFLWAHWMRKAGLVPQAIKYCRFLPPLNWSLERLLQWERWLRRIPGIAEFGAIGFMLIAHKRTGASETQSPADRNLATAE